MSEHASKTAGQPEERSFTFELVRDIVATVSDHLLQWHRIVNFREAADAIVRLQEEAAQLHLGLRESYERERNFTSSQMGSYTGPAAVAYTSVLRRIDTQIRSLRLQQLIDRFLYDFEYHLTRHSKFRPMFDPNALVVAVVRMVSKVEAGINQLSPNSEDEWRFDPYTGANTPEARNAALRVRLNQILEIAG